LPHLRNHHGEQFFLVKSFVFLFDGQNLNVLQDISNPVFSFESEEPKNGALKSLGSVEPDFIFSDALGHYFANIIQEFDNQWPK
jgi:hypothetical protein